MLRILLDQNFDHDILRGLRNHLPGLDEVTTQTLGKERETDSELLRLASVERRVILTHDAKTFPKYSYEQIARGETIYGVIIVPADLPVGKAIADLISLIGSSPEDDLVNQVKYLPLR